MRFFPGNPATRLLKVKEGHARMLLAQIASDPRVIFVTGKGGVGKTTTAAVLTQLAREAGLSCAQIFLGEFTALEVPAEDVEETEPTEFANKPSFDSLAQPTEFITIDPADALVEYMQDHGFGKLASRLLATGIVGVVATAIPGIKDLLILGKIKQIEKEGGYDLLVVDAPATGHTLSFLTSPEGLLDIAKVGPLRTQAEDVLEMLGDKTRTGCVIVTLPEETPVAEALELEGILKEKTSIHVTSIVVNQVLPLLSGEAELEARELPESSPQMRALAFRREREALQQAHLKELVDGSQLPVISLSQVFGEEDSLDLAGILVEELGQNETLTS